MTTTEPTTTQDTVMQVQNLVVEFASRHRGHPPVRAVDDVSFTIPKGATVGLVGESGSGKSTIGRAILGLTKTTSGTVRLGEIDLSNYRAGTSTEVARRMQVVFQDPFSSLNPSRTIGRTLGEAIQVQQRRSYTSALDDVDRLLQEVGLPADTVDRYPFGFSGGQRQRIAIARALSTSPELIICDEAVSALDLVTRAQVINLLAELQNQTKASLLFIAHDLPVVSHIAQWTVVLYRGRIMEQGPAREINQTPMHPYTQALVSAVMVADPHEQAQRRQRRQEAIRTTTANAKTPPAQACPFASRCPFVADVCWSQRPADTVVQGRTVACHRYDPQAGHPEPVDETTSDSAQPASAPAQGVPLRKAVGDGSILG